MGGGVGAWGVGWEHGGCGWGGSMGGVAGVGAWGVWLGGSMGGVAGVGAWGVWLGGSMGVWLGWEHGGCGWGGVGMGALVLGLRWGHDWLGA